MKKKVEMNLEELQAEQQQDCGESCECTRSKIDSFVKKIKGFFGSKKTESNGKGEDCCNR